MSPSSSICYYYYSLIVFLFLHSLNGEVARAQKVFGRLRWRSPRRAGEGSVRAVAWHRRDAPLLQTSNVVPESPGIRHQLVDEGNRVPLGLLVLDGSRRVHLFALSGFLGHTPRLQPTWAILAIVLKEGVWVWWWRGNSYGLGALPGRPRSTSGQDRRVYHGGTPNGLERNFAVTCGTSFEKDLVFRIRNRKRWSRT